MIRIPASQPEPVTIADCICAAARRMQVAGLCVGHSEDNALDEARALVLHALHLPDPWPAVYAHAALTEFEVAHVDALIERRIRDRIPAAYLIGHASFAGLRLRSDARALVPRSPIAELIASGFQPWLGELEVTRALDLCCGGGSIGLAMAAYHPTWQVDAADISAEALRLAAENRALLRLDERVDLVQSDLYAGLQGRMYELIVSNPPYISASEYAGLPAEYAHEPRLGLQSGIDGCDAALRILHGAGTHLSPEGLLIVEVGESDKRLRALLPFLPWHWIEFSVGQMGVFALRAQDLRQHASAIAELCRGRGLC